MKPTNILALPEKGLAITDLWASQSHPRPINQTSLSPVIPLFEGGAVGGLNNSVCNEFSLFMLRTSDHSPKSSITKRRLDGTRAIAAYKESNLLYNSQAGNPQEQSTGWFYTSGLAQLPALNPADTILK